MVRVIFVCLGNICRSPLAEGVFEKLIQEKGLSEKYSADSAGTSAYHIGELADPRSRSTANKHGFELTHRAQQFKREHFESFDLIVAMDESNLRDIMQLSREQDHGRKVVMMSKYDLNSIFPVNVPDPYFGGDDGFDEVYTQLLHCCSGLIDYLETMD